MQNSHIKDVQIRGRTVMFVVDDVDATINEFAKEYDISGKNIQAKVTHRVGAHIKEETGVKRIKVIFTDAAKKIGVALPKFAAGENGQLTVVTE
jgi:hypothetical protein